jgi:hypothetical protein
MAVFKDITSPLTSQTSQEGHMMNQPKWRQSMLEDLQLQIDLLEGVQRRHQKWATEVDSRDLQNIHHEIIGLLIETREKYTMLIANYNTSHE